MNYKRINIFHDTVAKSLLLHLKEILLDKLCRSLKCILIELVHFVIRIGRAKRGGWSSFEYIEKPFPLRFSGFMRHDRSARSKFKFRDGISRGFSDFYR